MIICHINTHLKIEIFPLILTQSGTYMEKLNKAHQKNSPNLHKKKNREAFVELDNYGKSHSFLLINNKSTEPLFSSTHVFLTFSLYIQISKFPKYSNSNSNNQNPFLHHLYFQFHFFLIDWSPIVYSCKYQAFIFICFVLLGYWMRD